MARPLRIERAGGWYHVTARGNERRPIFRDDRDRRRFLELLAEMVLRFRLRLHGYVLMDNHYHLLLELTEANLSRAVQWLNVSYGVWFNRRHGRSGHLFQGRFKSVLVSPEEWGLALSRYLHLNPSRIKALGLGKAEQKAQATGLSSKPDPEQVRQRIRRLRQYRWSSYRAYIGLEKQPLWLECERVLELGGGNRTVRRQKYREYVEAAVQEGLSDRPWESLRERVILGGEKFLAKVKRHVRGNAQEQRAAARLMRERPTLKAVIGAVERVKGQRWEEFRDRHGDRGRDMVLYLGRRLCGLKLAQLAEAVGLKNYAVAGTNAWRYEQLLQTDRAEQKFMKQVCQLLDCEM